MKITRAKSRTTSPRGRSRSSTWSLPKSPRQRSCSWSKEADAADTERKENEKTERRDGVKEVNNKEGNKKERSDKAISKREDSKRESSRSESTKGRSKDEVRTEAPAS